MLRSASVATGMGLGALAACAHGTVTDGDVQASAGPSFDVTPDAGASPIQPTLGPTITASQPPRPISGGTLIGSRDGTLAVAADSDRDAVYIVNLGSLAVQTIALQAGDEPGRLVEDGAGMVHVALRGAGAIVTIDPRAGRVTDRQAVCPAPRGAAWDPSTQLVWVACATGELVGLPAAGGPPVRSLVVERDLRDVLVSGGSVAVSQFRSAHVLRLAEDGTVSRRDALPSVTSGFTSQVVWRAVTGPSGTLAAVYEEESTSPVTTQVQGAYGGCGGIGAGSSDAGVDAGGLGCSTIAAFASPLPVGVPPGDPGSGVTTPDVGCFTGAIVHSDFTLMGVDGSVLLNLPIAGAVPVDVALSADGSLAAIAVPGNTFGPGLSTVIEMGVCDGSLKRSMAVGGEPIAVAFDAANHLLVQSREPAQLWVLDDGGEYPVHLAASSRKDTGHDLFHVQAGGAIACASCHPEGGDDGHVWQLDGNARRTPSLRGTIAGTAPYHWPGDMKDLPALFDDVYTVRMSGATLAADQIEALSKWVQSIPAPPAPSWVDPASAARGKTFFEQARVGCAGCHSGDKLTDNRTVDVGTGGPFQVPPLVGLGWRAPFLHDGCASTLADRFGACSTAAHGNVSSLSAGDVTDLEAYLETL